MPRRLAQLKRSAREGHPTTFITLTVNAQRGQSPEDRAQELVEAMRVMFKRARRKFRKEKLEYLAVFEETKRGEPHLHILARAPFIPQKWLSDQMDELIQAPIVDIRRVGSAWGAARYVAKYVAKGPKSFGTLKRYWQTPGYNPVSDEERSRRREFGSGWSVEKQSIYLLSEDWRKMGYHVEWLSDTEIAVVPTGLNNTS